MFFFVHEKIWILNERLRITTQWNKCKKQRHAHKWVDIFWAKNWDMLIYITRCNTPIDIKSIHMWRNSPGWIFCTDRSNIFWTLYFTPIFRSGTIQLIFCACTFNSYICLFHWGYRMWLWNMCTHTLTDETDELQLGCIAYSTCTNTCILCVYVTEQNVSKNTKIWSTHPNTYEYVHFKDNCPNRTRHEHFHYVLWRSSVTFVWWWFFFFSLLIAILKQTRKGGGRKNPINI